MDVVDSPGVFDMPEDVYHADRWLPTASLSSSLARTIINRSALHAWCASPRLNPNFKPKHSDTFDLGKAAHAMILGKGAAIEVVEADDWRTKAAKDQRDLARISGRTPMLAANYETLLAMVEAVEAQLLDFGLDLSRRNNAARNEIVAAAEIDGVWCRAMIDHVPDDPLAPLIDVKTTDDASPDACIRSITSYGYDVQMAHYLATWYGATEQRRGFRFVFVEKAPPYGVSVIELADEGEGDWYTTAADKAREARRRWGECLRSGDWPGYPARVAVVGAPGWYTAKWESLP